MLFSFYALAKGSQASTVVVDISIVSYFETSSHRQPTVANLRARCIGYGPLHNLRNTHGGRTVIQVREVVGIRQASFAIGRGNRWRSGEHRDSLINIPHHRILYHMIDYR